MREDLPEMFGLQVDGTRGNGKPKKRWTKVDKDFVERRGLILQGNERRGRDRRN